MGNHTTNNFSMRFTKDEDIVLYSLNILSSRIFLKLRKIIWGLGDLRHNPL